MALALVTAGCATGEDEDAIAACSSFQEHLESMREADGRGEGLQLARTAADAAERSDDGDLAQAFEDYRRVIVRFVLVEEDVQAAQDRVDGADDGDLARAEDELTDAEERLAELIEAGDLVLTQINAGCGQHGVTLE